MLRAPLSLGQVSRFLGDTDLPPPRSAVPSVRVLELPPAAAAATSFTLLLASDGLWDVISVEELPALLDELQRASPWADADEQAAALRDEAFLRGSTDNVTVVVLCVRTMSDCVAGP